MIEKASTFKLTYGLFVLTARDGDKDNGCIINTAQQVVVNLIIKKHPTEIPLTLNDSKKIKKENKNNIEK